MQNFCSRLDFSILIPCHGGLLFILSSREAEHGGEIFAVFASFRPSGSQSSFLGPKISYNGCESHLFLVSQLFGHLFLSLKFVVSSNSWGQMT